MQEIAVPEGDHNPNGYTRQEILDALRGVDGSRHLSFRYELLDMHDNKIRDLVDEVERCSIEQNWLAEIKRKARFTIHDHGEIEWLTDRIKPWIKLHMPPRISHVGQELDDLWQNTFEGANNETVAPTGSEDSITSIEGTVQYSDAFSATGDTSARLGASDGSVSGTVQFGIPVRRTWKLSLHVFIPFDGFLRIQHTGLDQDDTNDFVIDDLNGTYQFGETDFTSAAANLVDQHVRIDVVNDGRRARYRFFWTDPFGESPDAFGSDDSSDWDPVQTFRITGGGQNEDPSFVDDVSVSVPDDTEIVSRVRPIWRNSFNGTPGGTATISNLGSHGNPATVVRGELFYSDDWSADDRRSLQLGDDTGENAGEFQVNIPARLDWRLQFYCNVPAGGHLFVLPSSDSSISPPETEDVLGEGGNPDPQPPLREPTWIILDDENEEYSIAGTDVSEHKDDLIGKPIRIELETDGTEYRWRVYHVDPGGRSPDISWFGDSQSWGQIITFLVGGGGDETPPPLFDNMRIGEPIPTLVRTEPETNFVEWPQGIFLLTTPSRTLDQNGVITREVDGFDKLQIFEDDVTDGRISVSGIVAVQDRFLRVHSGTWGTVGRGTGIRAWVTEGMTNATHGVQISPRAWAFITIQSSPTTHRYVILERPTVTDCEIRTSVGVNTAATGGPIMPGVSFRWQSTTVNYNVRVVINTDSTVDLQLRRSGTILATATGVTTMTFPGQFVELRVRMIGNVVLARAWIPEEDEPTTWQINHDLPDDGDYIEDGRAGVIGVLDGSNSNSNPELRWRYYSLHIAPQGRYTDLVSTLLGDIPKRITPSPAVITTNKEWDPGTSKRVIINELLEAINYESLSFDEHGVAIVQPYVEPGDRHAEYDYFDDSVSVMHAEMEQELDLHQIPNRWIMFVADPDRPPIRVVFENRDPSSPMSIPRRGRPITEFIDVGEEADKSSMIEAVQRHAFQSTQVFEAVEFTTAIMPFHSGNDVYRVRREPLGVISKYSEHTWEMDLEAGAQMSHRARRVVNFDVSFDDTLLTGDLHVNGVLMPSNWAAGLINISPVASVPTSAVIAGIDLKGTGSVNAQCSIGSIAPSTARMNSIYYPTPYGMTIYLFQTNTVTTALSWFMSREA